MNKFLLKSVIAFVCIAVQGVAAYSLTNNGSGIGSSLGKSSTTRLGGYFNTSQASVIEYDTYGNKSGYYMEDSFGTTTKYDAKGNVLSRYNNSDSSGKIIVYDKYGHAVGYYLPVSKVKTMMYDKYNQPIGYFMTDKDGLVKKYDVDGTHLNTYKRQ